MRNRHRQSSRRARGMFHAEVQALEIRCLPAGTVTASFAGGNITLSGDSQDNFIEVDLTPSGTFVRGIEVDGVPTRIKLGAKIVSDGSPVRLTNGPGIASDLNVNLRDGNDGVEIYAGGSPGTPFDAHIGRNLRINTGRGHDFVEIYSNDGSLTINNELTIVLDAGDDFVSLDGGFGVEPDLPEDGVEIEQAPLHVGGLTKISGSTGDDGVDIVNFSTSGNLQIETGGGNDLVGLLYVEVGANAVITTGANHDDVAIVGTFVAGSTSINTGSGNDRVGILDAYSQGDVSVLLQQGNDTLAAAGSLSVGSNAKVTLNGGTGALGEIDTLDISLEIEAPPQTTFISFETLDSTDLAFEILDYVFGSLFGDSDP